MRGQASLDFQEFFTMPTDGSDEQRRIFKEALKEAIKEWLDEQFTHFGKWSMSGIAALALAALLYFILTNQGWQKTH
jgi:hypothetical protein